MKEIVAIHLGHYSNFVGSHWLNLQEACFSYNPNFMPDINNDMLFREGLTSSGIVTYTPRLLSVDLKGSLGHLPERGGLYDQLEPQDAIASIKDMKIQQNFEENIQPKNEFLLDIENIQQAPQTSNLQEAGDAVLLKSSYELDNSVNTWTDYLIPRLHPRTINLLQDYSVNKPGEQLHTYGEGLNAWSGNFEEEFTDRLRIYLEECNSIQGFHIISDIEDGFSGLSQKCHLHIRDECPKNAIFSPMPIFGQNQNCDMKSVMNRILNISLSISSCAELSDLIAPLGVVKSLWSTTDSCRKYNNIELNQLLKYHTSSLIAVGLDTATVPYRLRNLNMHMKDVVSSVNIVGRSVCGLGISLPFPMQRTKLLVPTLENFDGQLFQSLTPHLDLMEDNVVVQTLSSKGIKEQELGGKKFHSSEGDFDCRSVKECFQIFCKLKSLSTHSNISTTEQSLRCPVTFPKILNQDFNLKEMSGSVGQIAEYRVLAGLHNSDEMKTVLEELYTKAKQINPRRLESHFSSVLEHDELIETLEKLRSLSMNYSKTWEL